MCRALFFCCQRIFLLFGAKGERNTSGMAYRWKNNTIAAVFNRCLFPLSFQLQLGKNVLLYAFRSTGGHSVLVFGCFVAEYFLCENVGQSAEMFGFAKVIQCYLYTCSAALIVALCVRNDGAQIKILAWIGKYHSGNIYFYHSLLPRFINRLFGAAFMADIEPVLSFVIYLICIPLSMSVNKAWRFIKTTYSRFLAST